MTPALPFTAADRDFLATLRRDLHRHPELAWKEERTADRLEQALRECGATDVRRVCGTGVVARVRGTGRGATVAVRGDTDALPITEATGLPFASEHVGVMHACGHDIHASWAVGAALLLAREPADGDTIIILQPAEEVGEGARAMIEAGAVEGAQAIFGAHVDRRFQLGQVVAQPGPLAASTDTFRIIVRGKGAHGARPHMALDPVVGAANLVMAIQTIVSRRLDPGAPGVISVGVVRGGTAPNVIPDEVELAGTIRATTAETRTLLTTELARMAEAVAATHGLSAVVSLIEGTPPIVNPPDGAAWAAAAVRDLLGAESCVPLGLVNMGGEDFSYYLQDMPGCFMRVGAREPGGDVTDVHTARFAPAEDAIYIGAAVLAQSARNASAALGS
jgi:hippurate hydrolase